MAAGIVGCVAIARVSSGFAFEVSSLDPVSLSGAGAMALIATTFATYIPTRGVTRIDPLEILRVE